MLDEFYIEARGPGEACRSWTRSTYKIATLIADKAIRDLDYEVVYVFDILGGPFPIYVVQKDFFPLTAFDEVTT